MHSFRNGTPRILLALLVGVPGVSSLLSCSPSSGTAGLGSSHNGDGNGSSSGSNGGSGNNAGGDNGSGSDGNLIGLGDTGGTSGTGVGPDAGCQTETHQGERQAVDLYFILDQSGSMADGTPSKWSAVSSSLSTFLNDPANAGTGAGIGYFPASGGGSSGGGACTQGQPGCTCFLGFCFNASAITNIGGSCTVSDYAKPDVPIGQLPAVGPTIATSLQGHGPGGGTPTYPALQGTYQYASSWAVANPGRKTIVVLATDGDPNGCGANDVVGNATTTGTIAGDLVAPAYAGNSSANPPVPSIPTFVIGVGSSLTSLNSLAAAGGTGQAFIVDTGGNVAQQFADALDKIRGQAVSCNFSVPNDGTVDPTKVNATYTPPNASSIDVYNVADVSHCSADATANEWYYNGDKTQLILCPSICQTLAKGGGSVQVVLGCPTKPEILH